MYNFCQLCLHKAGKDIPHPPKNQLNKKIFKGGSVFIYLFFKIYRSMTFRKIDENCMKASYLTQGKCTSVFL